jgi:hypothetical protein
MKSKELEIRNSRSKLIWLMTCILFLLIFSTKLNSASKSGHKLKPEIHNLLLEQTVASVSSSAQFKIKIPVVENNTTSLTYSFSLEKWQLIAVNLPIACILKKKKLLRFRHHLKPSENEDLPS